MSLGCIRRFQLRARLGRPWHLRNVSSLTDPAVQISRSGFFKRNLLLQARVSRSEVATEGIVEGGRCVEPTSARPTRSAIEPVIPEPTGTAVKLPETRRVRPPPVVLVVAPELGIEDLCCRSSGT